MLVGSSTLPVVIGCALMMGCIPIPVPLPQPQPVSPERAGSALGALERLGRFDGSRFHPVAPHSVPPSHLYVLVHGWAPGWDDAVIRAPRLRSWEASDDAGEPFEPWMTTLAEAILDADPHAVVLAYSWLDDAATSRLLFAQRNAISHTDLHGRWLAEGITQATADDFIAEAGRMHLIGHSYGARVVTLAALYLPKKPQHITLFDSPDAPMTHFTGSQAMLESLLRKLPLGRGPGRVFVDNYVSMIGVRYGGREGLSAVVDVRLAPPYGAMDYRRRHLYPMEFYAKTGQRSFGLGWSPLIAAEAPPAGCYQQAYGRLALSLGCDGTP